MFYDSKIKSETYCRDILFVWSGSGSLINGRKKIIVLLLKVRSLLLKLYVKLSRTQVSEFTYYTRISKLPGPGLRAKKKRNDKTH